MRAPSSASTKEIYVIGSGLNGVAAAWALVKRGYHPTILDSGLGPDPHTESLKKRLASSEPEQWDAADVALMKRTGPEAVNGIPRKLSFGSDFPYRDTDPSTIPQLDRAALYRSLARGGFSNVWGAVLHTLPAKELQSWPITADELAPHYAAIRTLITGKTSVLPSGQARALYRDLSLGRRKLDHLGIRFEFADLAVRGGEHDSENGCRRCGLCLHGCPYDAIYTAGATLSRLIAEGVVSYVPGIVVDRLVSAEGRIRIEARSLADNARKDFHGRLVMLATGVLESARILLRSNAAGTAEVRIRNSDIFTFPLMRYQWSDAASERLHTLCQMVLDIDDDAICSHTVRLQLYGYNDLYMKLLQHRMGRLSTLMAPFLRAAAGRLMVAFGYLHSDVSSVIKARLSPDNPARLLAEGEPNPKAWRVGRSVSWKILQARAHLRALPAARIRFDLPGGSYHCGGSFPMKLHPKASETDPWGCLPSLPGVHIVDASVLPTVPASPLTLTTMANAHRIASECSIPHAR